MMTNKIGRNDSCPCGSGKKYKKCCISKFEHYHKVTDFSWRKLRQTEGNVVDKHLMPYATQELPTEVIETALNDFLPEEDLPDAMDKDRLYHNFFIPWLLFSWIPLENFGISGFESEKTIAQNYLKAYETRLNSAERRFIDEMSHTYYSFYSLLEVEFEKSLVVKDILLGTMHTLKERQGTHHLKRGDIVFGRILTLDDQSIFIGMAPFLVPTHYHNNLIDIRQWLIEENDNQELDGTILREEFETELKHCFFEIMKNSFDRPLPIFLNTDGEPIQFSRSCFKLTITQEDALKLLLPLTLSKNYEKFLQDAIRDDTGAIVQIHLPWQKKGNKKHKNWDNTIMGHITLEKDSLILETNSENRTQKGKKLLTKYLCDNICFQQTLIDSPESETYNKNQMTQELLESPEYQEQIKEMINAHWSSWFDEPIPALDNKTPREAAKTKLGKEKLDALLLQYDNNNLNIANDNFLKVDVDYLRRELALD